MFKHLKLHAFILLAIMGMTSSCGFLGDDPPESQFKADVESCDLDTDTFSTQFFERDVAKQISCFETSILQAFQLIQTHSDHIITERDLRAVVNTFFPADRTAILKGLKVLFKINMLFLRDDVDRISRQNVKPLFEILRSINRETLLLSNLLKKMNEKNYRKLRPNFFKSLLRLSATTITLIDRNAQQSRALNIRTFLVDLRQSFNIPDIDNDLISQLAFFKKLFVGGQSEMLTSTELKTLLEKLPNLAIYGLDLVYGLEHYYVEMKNTTQADVYFRLREELKSQVHSITNLFAGLIAKRDRFPSASLDLISLFEKLISTMPNDYQIGRDEIQAALFLKKVFLGGDNRTITTQEIKSFLNKIGPILLASIDALIVSPDHFKNNSDYFKLLLGNINDIEKEFYPLPPDQEIFRFDNLITLANVFFKDTNFENFRPPLEKLKLALIGGDKNSFNIEDLKSMIQLIRESFENLYFNDLTYVHYKEVMESPGPVQLGPIDTILGHELISTPKRLLELKSQFRDITAKFRHLRNSNGVQYYGKDYKRYRYGFSEVGLVYDVIRRLMPHFGSVKKDTFSHYNVDICELNEIFLTFKPFLVELDLWTVDFKTFSRDILLLSDLFQNRSNGNSYIDVDEAVEFAILVMNSVGLAEDVLLQLTKSEKNIAGLCPNISDQPNSPQVSIACYREHFYDVFLNTLGHKKSHPSLNRFLNQASSSNKKRLLISIENFARDNADDSIPMFKRDLGKVIGALLNVESTILRFDTNKNNQVDINELEKALKVYREGILKIEPKLQNIPIFKDGILRAAFLYMVDKMSIPTPWQLTLYIPRNKDHVVAQRLNISVLLDNLIQLADQQDHSDQCKEE